MLGLGLEFEDLVFEFVAESVTALMDLLFFVDCDLVCELELHLVPNSASVLLLQTSLTFATFV